MRGEDRRAHEAGDVVRVRGPILEPGADVDEAGVEQPRVGLARTGERPRLETEELGRELARDGVDDLAHMSDVALAAALDLEAPARAQP